MGFYGVYLYGRDTRAFRWDEYGLLVVAAVIPLGVIYATFGPKIIGFYIASIFVGLAVEFLMGLVFHKTLNRRMWTYHRYTAGGYTSLLVAPFWGMAGILFVLLGRVFGF